MPNQSITVELDDQTIAYLATLGNPIEVLTRLACSTADSVRHPAQQKREQTDESLRVERETADTGRADGQVDSLAAERQSTDADLTGERAQADTVLVDQREANAQLLTSTIRAHDLALEADVARGRAETSESELRTVAEFREMFIGILGHDLRNPVSSIVMAAALMLRRGQLDEQDAETAARIIRVSQRITRMITQLLDLTRARLGGGVAIERKPTDLREICQNVVEEFDSPIQLEVDGDVTGNWDGDRLAEVLSNLAGNALEYHAPETPVIIKAHVDEADVVVEVTNQGEPIPADQLPFIFEPFRRAQQERSTAGNLGLGLYIASQIVLAHHGTLDVHSADRATTFRMRLPREQVSAPATPH